jgi:HEAT repeat protein
MVSLGELRNPSAIPILLRGITDSKRLVRTRSAESLLKIDADQSDIFEKVVATNDRYGIDAYLTALDNAGAVGAVQAKVTQLQPSAGKDTLLEILSVRLSSTTSLAPRSAASAKAATAS